MSKAPQCPSTVGELPPEKPRTAMAISDASGRVYWRALDELADTPEFRDFLEREFPAHASELRDSSRRDFLRVMAASIALAGAAATVPGCRRPDHRIMPYTRDPEDVTHGKPLFYATAMPLPGGGAEGLLAETYEGRPVKLEGNPLHPVNQGKSSALAQAALLDLYDPDRLVGPMRRSGAGLQERATWEEFEAFAGPHFARFDNLRGRGLAFLVDKTTSPSRNALRDRIAQRWPEARWLPYEAIDNEAAREGSRIALGAPHAELLSLEKARVILAIDRDFLACSGEAGTLPDARGFAAGRRVLTTHGAGSEMSRIYAVESMMSLAGGSADHRLRLRPSQIGPYLAALASAVADKLGSRAGALGSLAGRNSGAAAALGIDQEWIDAVADDLVAAGRNAVVLVGGAQPPEAHALGIALNAALGAIGETVRYAPLTGDVAASSLDSIRAVAEGAGAWLDTLVVIGCNPVYDAPADLDFAARYARIPNTIHLGLHLDETAAASTWRLNRAHFLETWGDVVAMEGAHSVIQPMILPLAFDAAQIPAGRSELSVLSIILGERSRDPYEIVRATLRAAAGEANLETTWRRALHDGVVPGTAGSALRAGRAPAVNGGAVSTATSRIGAPADAGFEVVFRPSATLWDGRHANNGWLQELPDSVTKMTWDNPALISPATAARLGLTDGQMASITVAGRAMSLPILRLPGLADDTVVLELGYGRAVSGRIGTGVGFNTYALRATTAMRHAAAAGVDPESGRYQLANVQTHWVMEGRPIVLEADLPAWRKYGDEHIVEKDAYGHARELTFGQRIPPSLDPHVPANVDVYEPDQRHVYRTRPQWAMSIDLTTCSGCGACTIACQAENNIPVVGKDQVARGREMHWIRVDRYFASPPGEPEPVKPLSQTTTKAGAYTGGRTIEDPEMVFMPVPCMHCETAPCETVCPVNATTHGREGLNEMVYNRCIGTRYCSNNCPYKVRRFNYFDYATKRLNGDYAGKSLLEGVLPNEHYIPPRLRERIDEGVGEMETLHFNPDVTVRERGVMEKCTYCVQRINESRIETKLMGLDHIPDGFFTTACAQACPTDSIVFGDMEDPLSRVRAMHDHGRTYFLLSHLNTRARTRYMARIRNPNPRLRPPVEDPFEHHGHHDDHGHDADHGGASHDAGHVMSLPVLPSPARAGGVA